MTKKNKITWEYNEFAQVGKDYGKAEEVAEFESRHSDFRDLKGESLRVLDTLGVGEHDILIDFGCGTGIFAILAAERCRQAHGVDVSKAMLDYARIKARKAGAGNIDFHHGGFLTFEYDGPPADFITSTLALHHLPDFWKRIALERMHRMLKPGGRLYLNDVVIVPEGAFANIEALLARLGEAGGREMRQDAEDHFRLEFSTYDWIMAGLLTRAGFTIDNSEIRDGVIATYYCTRQP
ncbi:MAG: methyltransferase domain-containing protein [Proteobacteria bacterium]|nr:methyltransferase domain-containing protein [Pseudomonadota bacterium]MBU1738184.1 methyltransferase domain-containing protein [Pseudomonadota bacterium]